MSTTTPPSHLSPAAKRLWKAVLADYHIDDAAGLALLRVACEATDRAEGARKLIAVDGAVHKDRFGQVKAHPACAIERDARTQLISALRALKLEPGGD